MNGNGNKKRYNVPLAFSFCEYIISAIFHCEFSNKKVSHCQAEKKVIYLFMYFSFVAIWSMVTGLLLEETLLMSYGFDTWIDWAGLASM